MYSKDMNSIFISLRKKVHEKERQAVRREIKIIAWQFYGQIELLNIKDVLTLNVPQISFLATPSQTWNIFRLIW